MDFRKELAKELGLGTIAENTMLDDYVKASEAIAIRYHESEVEKFRLGDVSSLLPLTEVLELNVCIEKLNAKQITLEEFVSDVWNTAYRVGYDMAFEQ